MELDLVVSANGLSESELISVDRERAHGLGELLAQACSRRRG